jgi:hypothetical protein
MDLNRVEHLPGVFPPRLQCLHSRREFRRATVLPTHARVSVLTPFWPPSDRGGVKRASSQLREEILHSLIKAVQQLVAQAAKSPRQGPRMEVR